MILTCVVIALAAAACAVTVTRSRLFAAVREYPREYRARFYPEFDNKGWQLFDALLRCTYCVAHWTAAAIVAIYRPRLVHLLAPLDVIITGLAVIAVAACMAALLCRAYDFASARE